MKYVDVKRKRIAILLNSKEKEMIVNSAKDLNISVSEFFRLMFDFYSKNKKEQSSYIKYLNEVKEKNLKEA